MKESFENARRQNPMSRKEAARILRRARNTINTISWRDHRVERRKASLQALAYMKREGMIEPKKTKAPEPLDLVGSIIAYETGEMDAQEMIEFFSHLTATGVVWQLQGHYGRTASRMIQAGYFDEKGIIDQERVDDALDS